MKNQRTMVRTIKQTSKQDVNTVSSVMVDLVRSMGKYNVVRDTLLDSYNSISLYGRALTAN